jgi:hypothetical protein
MKAVGATRPSSQWGTVLRAVAAVSLVAIGSGCSGASLVPSERPENVEASDGGYPSSILITWDAPETAKDIEEYRVNRSGGDDPPVTVVVDAAARSYRDETIRFRGVAYSYRVVAVFDDGTTGASLPDTGYAIESVDIQVGSTPGSYAREYDATGSSSKSGGKVWFRFLAQGDWIYEVHATGSPIEVRLLGEEQLDPAPTRVPVQGDFAFAPPRSGIYYLEIEGGRGEVSVSHR